MKSTMNNYNPSTKDYKLDDATCSVKFSKRQLTIWEIFLNRLGVPKRFHESIKVIYLVHDWKNSEMIEINMHQLAWKVTSNNKDRKRVYNRLKKNLPRFFEWQDLQSFTIIDRKIETSPSLARYEKGITTKISYNFLMDENISNAFNIPLKSSEKTIKRYIEDILKSYPIIDENTDESKKPKPKRKIKDMAKVVTSNIQQMKMQTVDIAITADHLLDSNYMVMEEIATAILERIKQCPISENLIKTQ